LAIVQLYKELVTEMLAQAARVQRQMGMDIAEILKWVRIEPPFF
jgi:hypothetical protein